MKKIILLLYIAFIVSLSSAQQLSKVYVLSEGSGSPGSAKLSMLDLQNTSYTENIFNPGNLGLFPDGLIYHENHLYVTEQGNFGGSGKIYKLDTLGNVLSSTIVGTNPYSLTIANNKIYITNGPASNVSVLNLSDLSLVTTITVGVYPQEILAIDSKVFVANNSLFGGAGDSTVSVINAETDLVEHTIIVTKDPSSLTLSNDGFLLIGCPGDENTGKIFEVELNGYSITNTYTIPTYGFGKDLVTDKNNNDVYFISSLNDIVRFNLADNSVESVIPSVFPNNFYYGYNFDSMSKIHYVLDAKSFIVSGSLGIFDHSGNFLGSYTTGNAPRRVLLKYTGQSTGVEDELIVNSFNLEQNYPNPFNPATILSYTIGSSQLSGNTAMVTLTIFDMLGREIAIVVNEQQAAGTYEILFDASDVSSGTYIYNLNVTDGKISKSLSKKMTLIK